MSKRNKEPIICKICGKSIKNLGQHLNYSHPGLKVKDYYDKYIKQENEEICPTCGGYNNFQSIRKGYTKHCCPKCAQTDPQVRAKQENTNLDRYDNKYSIATTQAKEKSKQTKKDRYDSETYNNPEKMKQTKYDTYGEYFINKEKN